MTIEAPIILESPEPATRSVICLHGLGADGDNLKFLADELRPAFGDRTRFIFPHAPMRPVTINAGYPMRAWFDILSLGGDLKEDEAGIRDSARLIDDLIGHELRRGIMSHEIYLGGFSQGAAMSLHCGLRYPLRLGGIILFSGFLALAKTLAAEQHAANQHTPIFIAHGTEDPILPLQWAELTRDALQRLGHTVTWKTYPMPHSICPEELADLSAWLRELHKK